MLLKKINFFELVCLLRNSQVSLVEFEKLGLLLWNPQLPIRETEYWRWGTTQMMETNNEVLTWEVIRQKFLDKYFQGAPGLRRRPNLSNSTKKTWLLPSMQQVHDALFKEINILFSNILDQNPGCYILPPLHYISKKHLSRFIALLMYLVCNID
jgi:hypothetical protein